MHRCHLDLSMNKDKYVFSVQVVKNNTHDNYAIWCLVANDTHGHLVSVVPYSALTKLWSTLRWSLPYIFSP